ncbi:hypothetical protein C4J81_01070 [Deltaproteobacteria bacterium Smac51]|nr:hypothetical protein C4J81_01070 [Deltaproteobacteria bacterium Smac51]
MKEKRGKRVAGLVAGLTSEDATAFEEILGRIKYASGAKSDAELAEKLGLQRSSISTAKSRQMVPSSWIINTSNLFNFSSDWLIYGDKREIFVDSSVPCRHRYENEDEPFRLVPEDHILNKLKDPFGLGSQGAQVESKPEPPKEQDRPLAIKSWILSLKPDFFDTLWNRFRRQSGETMRGWVQIELLKRFPEFLNWLNDNEAELKQEYMYELDAPLSIQEPSISWPEKNSKID